MDELWEVSNLLAPIPGLIFQPIMKEGSLFNRIYSLADSVLFDVGSSRGGGDLKSNALLNIPGIILVLKYPQFIHVCIAVQLI